MQLLFQGTFHPQPKADRSVHEVSFTKAVHVKSFRVVKENEQPLQKAVETLEPARRIYERFKGHHEKEARALEPLLAQIYQGLAVARLIFTPEAAVRNNEHGIKDKIHEDLKRALELRTSHADILGRRLQPLGRAGEVVLRHGCTRATPIVAVGCMRAIDQDRRRWNLGELIGHVVGRVAVGAHA